MDDMADLCCSAELACCPVLQGLFTNPERNAFRQPGAKQPMYRVRFRQASRACPACGSRVLFCHRAWIGPTPRQ